MTVLSDGNKAKNITRLILDKLIKKNFIWCV